MQSGPLATFWGRWVNLEEAKTRARMRSVVGAIGCRGLRLRGGRTVCAVLAPGESARLWQLLSSTSPASFSCRAAVPFLPHIQRLQVAFSLLPSPLWFFCVHERAHRLLGSAVAVRGGRTAQGPVSCLLTWWYLFALQRNCSALELGCPYSLQRVAALSVGSTVILLGFQCM